MPVASSNTPSLLKSKAKLSASSPGSVAVAIRVVVSPASSSPPPARLTLGATLLTITSKLVLTVLPASSLAVTVTKAEPPGPSVVGRV